MNSVAALEEVNAAKKKRRHRKNGTDEDEDGNEDGNEDRATGGSTQSRRPVQTSARKFPSASSMITITVIRADASPGPSADFRHAEQEEEDDDPFANEEEDSSRRATPAGSCQTGSDSGGGSDDPPVLKKPRTANGSSTPVRARKGKLRGEPYWRLYLIVHTA